MKTWQRFLNAIFPDKCLGCGQKPSLLCSSCLKKLAVAQTTEESFITSIFSYQDSIVKKLVWNLKYKNAKRVSMIFAPHLSSAILEFLGEQRLFLGQNQILLVPVPLSKKRQKTRGYNQSEVLALEIAKDIPNSKVENQLLVKTKETKPQTEIKKRSLRLLNPIDCFSVLKNNYSLRETIVLIDDVTTTGATLKAARNTLRAAGFRKIHAFTIAH